MNITTERNLFTWQAVSKNRVIVIPTNLTLKRDGTLVMGAGLAKQAASKLTALPRAFGDQVKTALAETQHDLFPKPIEGRLYAHGSVIALPTKRDWRDAADWDLIRLGLGSLLELARKRPDLEFGVPAVGAGLGGLDRGEIIKLITETFKTCPNVTFVDDKSEDTAGPFKPQFPTHLLALVHGKKVMTVTGHRGDKLGGYDPQARDLLRDFWCSVFQRHQPDFVVSGFAPGADTGAAEACEILGIPLIAAIPCQGHADRLPKHPRATYDRLLKYAQRTGGVFVVTEKTYDEVGPRCMQDRNVWMVELARKAGAGSGVVALWDGTDGGTKNCLKYVRETHAPYIGNYWRAYYHGAPAVFQQGLRAPGAGAGTQVSVTQNQAA